MAPAAAACRPSRARVLATAAVVAAACGLPRVLAGGDVYSFGRNMEGQLGLGDNTQRNSPAIRGWATEILSPRQPTEIMCQPRR